MPAEIQVAIWGLAALAPLVLNMATRRGPDAIGLSGMLVAMWCIGRVMAALFTVPESMTIYPIEDALAGAICMFAWRSRKAAWKIALAFLFVAQCALHAAFWLAWESGEHQALLFYVTANNAIFALELLTAGWGAVVYVARSLVARLPSMAGHGHHGRFGR